jgi:hypothetical protein
MIIVLAMQRLATCAVGTKEEKIKAIRDVIELLQCWENIDAKENQNNKRD